MRSFFKKINLRIKKYLCIHSSTEWIYKKLSKLKGLPHSKRKRRNIQSAGFELISMIHKSLIEADVFYFVDFGTLLGMIREQNFIKHDLDIDIGIIMNEHVSTDFIRDILKKNGFILKYEYIYKDKSVEDSFMYKGIKVDINYYVNDDSSSKCWLFYQDPKVIYEENTFDVVELKYSIISKSQIIKVKDTEMQIPIDAETLLEEKYGPNWKVPNKDWIYWKAPSATYCEGVGYRVVHN